MLNSPDLAELQRRAREHDAAHTLQRTLTGNQLVIFGIGVIIGAGIFVSTGIVAAHHAGPAVVFSFLLAAAACLCAGLCYAEFAAIVPTSGSAYTYVYAAFGRFPAWLIGWCLILEYLMAAATVAVGWSAYLIGFLSSLGIHVTPLVASAPFELSPSGALTRAPALVNLPAILLLAALTACVIAGIRFSVRVNALLVAIKLTVIGLFIVCGIWFVDPSHWTPFVPPNSGRYGEFGWSGILRGASVIFYAYLGFDALATAARETHDAQRNMPRGIIGSLLVCTIIYILFALVLTGLAPYAELAAPNPASVALDHAGPRLYFLKVAIEIGALTGLTSVVLVLLYAQSRVLYAMAQDRVVPLAFGRISGRSRTPYASAIACGIIAILSAGLLPIGVLGELISIGTLAAFVFVCAGVLWLRIKRPDLERPFRTPCGPFVCVAGIAICSYLMSALPAATWLRFAAWISVGIAIYLVFGRRHGRERESLLHLQ